MTNTAKLFIVTILTLLLALSVYLYFFSLQAPAMSSCYTVSETLDDSVTVSVTTDYQFIEDSECTITSITVCFDTSCEIEYYEDEESITLSTITSFTDTILDMVVFLYDLY